MDSELPFDPVSRRFPAVVCSSALALVRGVIDGIGAESVEVWQVERPGWCCVTMAPHAGGLEPPSP